MGNCAVKDGCGGQSELRDQLRHRKKTVQKKLKKPAETLPAPFEVAPSSELYMQVCEERLGAHFMNEARMAREDTIGEGMLLYTDHTASGRGSRNIERFLQREVLPWYANTHTEASATGRQTTGFREEARQLIKDYYACGAADALIFTGSGATGAIAVFTEIVRRTEGFTQSGGDRAALWGQHCTACNENFRTQSGYKAHLATAHHQMAVAHLEAKGSKVGKKGGAWSGCLLLTDPMSHHSSILPFRELAEKYPKVFRHETIALDTGKGHFCAADLRQRLRESRQQKLRAVVVLCGASNVTGIRPSSMETVNGWVHGVNGVVCWDLAGLAAHAPVKFGTADFAFISPHKLLGGPGTPGVLLAKRALLTHEKPTIVGGGVVDYVLPQGHAYTAGLEGREEAGTPNILGCIKAGLVYRMHALLNPAKVAHQEEIMLKYLTAGLRRHPAVRILGDKCVPDGGRIGIVSFNILYGEGKNKLYLHYNFVTALLSDLFGVQVRGGCACAGPYASWLLGIPKVATDGIVHVLETTGLDAYKPGFVRTGVHFTMSKEDLDTVIAAVHWVADKGWKMLLAYECDEATGQWKRRDRAVGAGKSLTSFSLAGGKEEEEEEARPGLQQLLQTADAALAEIADSSTFEEAEDAAQRRHEVDRRAVRQDLLNEMSVFAFPCDLLYSMKQQKKTGGALRPLVARQKPSQWVDIM